LTPFNVRHKQEGSKDNPAVAYLRYIEININGVQYRLLKKEKLFSKVIPFTINGVSRTAPFTDPTGINIAINGGMLSFSTSFGLTVSWNGVSKVEETLCDAYSNYVCGLCGNGDRKFLYIYIHYKNKFSVKINKKNLYIENGENDFVDRINKPVPLEGDKYTKFFNWGSNWRVFDDSFDADQSVYL